MSVQKVYATTQDVMNDPRAIADLRDIVLLEAAEARGDVAKFFEYVMVEENTRARLKIAPHQRVGMDFILSHDRSVNLWPVGHSKTFLAVALSLFFLGRDPTSRGVIVSATQGQASKVVGMARDYLETSTPLRAVFPHLRPSLRRGDPWTQTEITIDRPVGIRDPSLAAVGIDGALDGARLNWVVVDDILTRENTATKEQRDKVYEWFDSSVLSRLDPRGARIVVTNTAWHPDDLLHRLERQGWPTIRMDILGDIEVRCPVIYTDVGTHYEDTWGEGGDVANEIRPADVDGCYQVEERPGAPSGWRARLRLTAHDPDPGNAQTLWPGRYDSNGVARLRREHLPHRFNQLYRNVCRDDDTARCKQEYIEACKKRARDMGRFSLVSEWRDGGVPTFTGVDLAVSPGEESDECAFFTFAAMPNGVRVILDIETGQFSGPEIVAKILDKAKRYNSIVTVENNGCQAFIKQFTLHVDASVPVKAYTTGRSKAHPEHGVEALFIELANGAWAIPNDIRERCHPEVQKFVDACLYYSPSRHTDDVIMANFFAREQAKGYGVLSGSDTAGFGGDYGSLGAMIMAR